MVQIALDLEEAFDGEGKQTLGKACTTYILRGAIGM